MRAIKNYVIELRIPMLKRVVCESCRADYVYKSFARAEGVCKYVASSSSSSESCWEQAEQFAWHNLRTSISGTVVAIPCPSCGFVQSSSHAQVRWQKRWWLPFVGTFATIFVAIAIALNYSAIVNAAPDKPPPIPWLVLWASLTVAILAMAVGIGLYLLFDPNAGDPQLRIAQAQAIAVLRQELESGAAGFRFEPGAVVLLDDNLPVPASEDQVDYLSWNASEDHVREAIEAVAIRKTRGM